MGHVVTYITETCKALSHGGNIFSFKKLSDGIIFILKYFSSALRGKKQIKGRRKTAIMGIFRRRGYSTIENRNISSLTKNLVKTHHLHKEIKIDVLFTAHTRQTAKRRRGLEKQGLTLSCFERGGNQQQNPSLIFFADYVGMPETDRPL